VAADKMVSVMLLWLSSFVEAKPSPPLMINLMPIPSSLRKPENWGVQFLTMLVLLISFRTLASAYDEPKLPAYLTANSAISSNFKPLRRT
jgi:hypothetical protein